MRTNHKKAEKRCLHITKSNLQWLRAYHNISEREQERPDFVLSNGKEKIGLEHFLVDTLWCNGSQTRKSQKRLESLGKDNNEIVDGLTDAVSGYFNAYKNFSYDTFLNNFRRIFDKHLKNVSVYKQDMDKIGFLIEIPVLDFEYDMIDGSGSLVSKHIKGIPFTYGIWNIINQFDEVDFVIVTVLKINSKKNKSYYFDKTHMPATIYKSFSFSEIE